MHRIATLASWLLLSCALASCSAPPSRPVDAVRGGATSLASTSGSAPPSIACASGEAMLERAAKGEGSVLVSPDGAFAARLVSDGALVFALGGKRPVLAAVVGGPPGSPTFDGHRLLLQREHDLDWVDLDTKATGTIANAIAFAIQGEVRLVAGNRSIRRFDERWKLQGEMTLDFDIEPTAIELELLRGRYVRAGKALVRLDDQKVVLRGDLRSLDVAGQRAVYCSEQNELVAMELETGREIVRLAGQEAACSYSRPAFADGARYLVWFTGGDDGGAVVHTVDVTTKTETTTEDRTAPFGGLLVAASTDAKDDRKLCLGLAGKTWAQEACYWVVAGGRARRIGGPPKAPMRSTSWAKRLQLDGSELASVEDEKTGRVAVATYRGASGASERGSHLEVHVAHKEAKKVLLSIVVREEPFAFDWLSLGMGEPPALTFVGDDRVVFHGGRPSALPTVVIDTATGAMTKVGGDDVSRTDAPHLLLVSPGGLFDARRGKALDFAIDEKAFRAVPRLGNPCGGEGPRAR